jgi:hypothetical protein
VAKPITFYLNDCLLPKSIVLQEGDIVQFEVSKGSGGGKKNKNQGSARAVKVQLVGDDGELIELSEEEMASRNGKASGGVGADTSSSSLRKSPLLKPATSTLKPASVKPAALITSGSSLRPGGMGMGVASLRPGGGGSMGISISPMAAGGFRPGGGMGMGMGRGRGAALGQPPTSSSMSSGPDSIGGEQRERIKGMVVTVKDTYGFIQPTNKGLRELFFTMKDVSSYDEALHGRRGASTDRAIKVKLPVYPGDHVSFVILEPGEGKGNGGRGKGKSGGKDGGKGGGQSQRAAQIRKETGGSGGYTFGRGGYGGMKAEEDSTGFLDDVLTGVGAFEFARTERLHTPIGRGRGMMGRGMGLNTNLGMGGLGSTPRGTPSVGSNGLDREDTSPPNAAGTAKGGGAQEWSVTVVVDWLKELDACKQPERVVLASSELLQVLERDDLPFAGIRFLVSVLSKVSVVCVFGKGVSCVCLEREEGERGSSVLTV